MFPGRFENLPNLIKFIVIYYLSTPLFLFLDLGLGFDFRVALLDEGSHKTLYYMFIFICAALCYWQPFWAPVIGIFENSISLFILILNTLLPIFNAPSQILSGESVSLPFSSTQAVLGFVIMAGIVVISFRANVELLHNKE